MSKLTTVLSQLDSIESNIKQAKEAVYDILELTNSMKRCIDLENEPMFSDIIDINNNAIKAAQALTEL